MTFASLADTMIEFAIGNLAVALPLGCLAWWLQRRGTQPFLAHLVWLIVLVKLVTPPLYSFRVAPPLPETAPAAVGFAPLPVANQPIAVAPDPGWLEAVNWPFAVIALWFAGSALVFVWSLVRVCRFDRLLAATSAPAATAYQNVAAEIAARLGLGKAPQLMQTAASISPMVWWLGGRVRIYLPRSMLEQMDPGEIASILGHEIGHVRRGDHLIRWLESLVAIVLWWNPFAWWARRNLRVCEEICCDAFVVSKIGASPDSYAGALVSAMELLATPTIHPVGLASRVNGGFIERRIKMILSGNTISDLPRWLRGTVLACAALLLPLGFTLAQDDDADDLESVRQWLESGVNSAFVTQEQADIMLRALEASKYQYITEFVSDDGHVVKVAGVQAVQFSQAAHEAAVEKALAFARDHFETQVASGEITAAEAQAIIEDLSNATAGGLDAGDGKAYYQSQYEIGLIDQDTARRRMEIIAEVERAWNESGQAAEFQVGPAGRRVVKIAAVPPAGAEVVDFRLVRDIDVDSIDIEVVEEEPAQ